MVRGDLLWQVQGRLDMQRNQRGLLPPNPMHVGSVGSLGSDYDGKARMQGLPGLRPNPPEKVAIGFGYVCCRSGQYRQRCRSVSCKLVHSSDVLKYGLNV